MANYVERSPSVEGYRALRDAVGWGNRVSVEATAFGMPRSLYWVSAWDGETLIGCGRIVGDGAQYFYVQDIIVLPSYQGQGIGKEIMEHVMAYLRTNAPKGAFLALMAAKGVAPFYYQFGFTERAQDSPGMFQIAE